MARRDLTVLYDAAALYDAAFSWDPTPEAEFYDGVLGAGRLLDVGCGTGRVLAALAARGREVVGLERSVAMAAVARSRGLAVIVGDMRAPIDGVYAGALSHLSTFRYLLTAADVTGHLDAMAAALPAAGARYAIDHDLIGPDFDPTHPGQTWTGRSGGLEVETTWRALGRPDGDVAREEAILRAGGVAHRSVEVLRAWTLASFGAAITAHGAFAIERWYAPPFAIAAPFRPVPWTPRDETRRVVTVLARSP